MARAANSGPQGKLACGHTVRGGEGGREGREGREGGKGEELWQGMGREDRDGNELTHKHTVK